MTLRVILLAALHPWAGAEVHTGTVQQAVPSTATPDAEASVLASASTLAPLAATATEGRVVRSYADVRGVPYSVEWDARSLRLGGAPALLLSGSVPRKYTSVNFAAPQL